MKTEQGHQCDVCGRMADKGDTFYEFILPPIPIKGSDAGSQFPGVGWIKNGRKTLAMLLACDGCQKRVLRWVDTGDVMTLPPGRLRTILTKIALKRGIANVDFKRLLAPEREPDHNPLPGCKPKEMQLSLGEETVVPGELLH